MKHTDPRFELIKKIAKQWLPDHHLKYSMVAGDASFRRYFRLQSAANSWVVMDAPPDKEDCRAFIDVTSRLRQVGLHAPEIYETDLEQGFLLLEDLGETQYKPLINEQNVDHHFPALFNCLEKFAKDVSSQGLSEYSARAFQYEMNLFPDWYLGQHKKQAFTISEQLAWEKLSAHLITSAQQQIQVFVHRDFHSCNLMQTPFNDPGIIDYQDAVHGPLSYDLVSLLWDRYITWPRERITNWCEEFRQQLSLDISPQEWQRQCDFMSLQRNLKIVGIFARLHYRDHKTGYLEMIPRFWDYCVDILERYPEFDTCLKSIDKSGCRPHA